MLEGRVAMEKRGGGPTPTNEDDQLRTKLAADLVALHPSLRIAPFDKGFSYGCVIETEDPECPVPYVQVGIKSGLLSFPYSADPAIIFPEVRRVIAVFERHGYVAYDAQSESVLTSSSDLEDSESSFEAERDAVLAQMEERGETVIGQTARKKLPWRLIGVVLFLVIAVGGVVVKQYYSGQGLKPHEVDRIKSMFKAPPNPTVETDARKSSARGSP